ncbi:sodium-dependent neutral amino acid transporter B(0)AT2 isoform X1 [Canis lupus baileyi]|uniref:Transporter n=3 Tax=Canis lupus TaxID=9612 RepID=A0A8I3NLL1_CANLF|nr:sodium-dependent neutral amino acid transporter B(0)AT2 isoform X1 [Canis lupus dingo]XP_025294904.1 sodium-dependent neutral amino acid transporter B(0)AT2 isoform X1 [Canis lupus dingo]XP_025294905.1 sodium-dependent neutral amino acid transporter B(0)AT2 isoform X1 [Canis lupus dingo]XP_025294906.1 sodium-dependent neutral amino acid transporter B(0)AT2 isoform X1 [Canis lupus dingo]XP_038307893.1 sodium-dependent neutral amino acid transporter B(0)AT2 isoform X5 [Canis lupus familiaris]
MPKNSKVVKRELDDEVIESVKDLLSNEDSADDAFKKSELIVDVQEEKDIDVEEESEVEDERPAWNSKLQYILAQVGYSVGLGNVWRFPYLCQKNGGGAYLLPYLILLLVIGIPLFFLELAVGQRIRRGSIGVWNYISPKLGGIGFASCVVCFFVGLYYNVIIGWSLFYFSQSFQQPLPWDQCPLVKNASHTFVEPECEKSSATTYYWYRETLNISSSISESGGLNWKMTVCLLAAWVVVCLAMIKGIQSSGKVMYFSSLFPYVVLICFLVRVLLLNGSIDGIRHMFTPKLEMMMEPRVWREAATQVFFALGLGFGGVIAFSSYNKRDNNCHFDAVLVSFVNFFTSVLATLVVFAVLGFKANVINEKCITENSKIIIKLLKMGNISQDIIPHHINLSAVTAEDYRLVYDIIQKVKEEEFPALHLNSCKIEDELNKAVQGTGLAFIAFTEAMTHFPASPFWSVMFFFMLVNLGIGSMFGTIEGIITPIVDTFKARKEILTVVCCLLAFCIGLIFVQRSGNYFVTMFDDYSATLPLLIIVILENIAVSFVYGIDKFMEDLKDMLGFAPNRYYYYMWKYISPLMLFSLLMASVVNMGLSPPGYNAWVEEKASEEFLSYPTWGLVVCILLMVLAILPIPAVFIIRRCNVIDNSSGNLASVTYKRGRVLKEPVNLEGDDASLIHGKISSEMSSPSFGKNIYRKQSGSPTLDTAPNGRYGIGYLMADMPDMPESDL